jgi:hypothetical protein
MNRAAGILIGGRQPNVGGAPVLGVVTERRGSGRAEGAIRDCPEGKSEVNATKRCGDYSKWPSPASDLAVCMRL